MGNHRCRLVIIFPICQNIRYSGVNRALGSSKSIRYSGACFHIFYCNSAGLSNVARYNGVFVIAEFVIAGCHCNVPLILLCMQMTLILVQLQKTQTSLNLKIVNDYINLIFVYTITIDYLNV